jgi:putative methyltransferase (TIGR04325 family)
MPAGRDLYLALAKNRLGIAYRGLFDSADSARAALSRSRTGDYDIVNKTKAKNKEKESQGLDTWFQVEDYALLFWLSKILKTDSVVLELGGSIGHFFYSIQRYHSCAAGVRWIVAELAAAVRLGTEIAQERGEARLTFLESSEIATAQPSDVFLTAGTLQYLEDPVWKILKSLAAFPSHVLIHNLPVHSTRNHWTLQRLKLCEVPYQIYSHTELVREMTNLGYRHVTDWSTPRQIEIPFHRDMQIEGYLGFYFTR